MANIAKLEVIVAGNASGMNRAMREAAGAVKGLQKTVGGAVGRINGLIGAMGLGLTTAGLMNMARAATEDAKSLALMANGLRNATNATDEQISAANDFVGVMSRQLGIADDELRPALTTLAQATGDVTKAQGLMGLAADIAADKQISLEAASKIVAKAYNGNTTALVKYYSSAKDAANPLAEVARLTQGAAEAASNTDPLTRLSIIFEEMTETIGSYLIPYLNAFATWMNTPQGQDTLAAIATAFQNIFTAVFNIVSFLANNAWLVGTIAGLVVMTKTFFAMYAIAKKVYGAMKGLTIAQLVAKSISTMVGPAALIAAGVALVAGIGMFVGLDALMGDNSPVNIPAVPAATTAALPTVTDPNLEREPKKGAKGGNAAGAAIKKTDDALKKAITTLQNKLAQIRKLIDDWGRKFQDSVSLSFGIIERGAGRIFRADRYVKELKRMKDALADYQTNMNRLKEMGGAAGVPLLNQILGMDPQEGAAVMRAFVDSPQLFQEAIATSNALGATGRAVGRDVSAMMGNQTEVEMLAEIKLLRADLAKGKNTYNIKSEMTAQQILTAIRTWEKSTGKKVLAG